MAYINGKKVVGMMRSAGGSESSTLITTTTDATLVSGSTYELALTYLTETPKVNDFIAYVNNGAITTLYKVTAVDSTNATLTKIGDIGGGKQLYQHNIFIAISGSSVFAYFNITNDSDEQATNLSDIVAMLSAKDITSKQKAITCTGRTGGSSISCVWTENNYLYFITSDTTGSNGYNSADSVKDTPVAL